jgi:predicted nucleic acid-binding protein
VRRIVLDAPLLLTWFGSDGGGRDMRRAYEAGSVAVVAPRSLPADVLALLARRDGWSGARLASAAAQLDLLGFDLRQPTATGLATWLARGLPVDRAAYPALAAELELPLATSDPELARIAGPLVTLA